MFFLSFDLKYFCLKWGFHFPDMSMIFISSENVPSEIFFKIEIAESENCLLDCISEIAHCCFAHAMCVAHIILCGLNFWCTLKNSHKVHNFKEFVIFCTALVSGYVRCMAQDNSKYSRLRVCA